MATAKALGLAAIAVTDRNTLAGVVRAHLAAREVGGIKFIVGARLDLDDAPSLLAYPTDRAAYGRLCRLLTLGQRRAEKGKCTLHLDDVAAHADGLIFIALPPDDFPSSRDFESELRASSRRLAPDAPLPRRQSLLSRRRPRPHRSACAIGGARWPSPRRHQRRALSRKPPPALAGRAHLHPREMHDP